MLNKRIVSLLLVVIILLLNFSLNIHLFKELIHPDPTQNLIDDSIVTEFLTQTSLQKLRNFENPFIVRNSILYPYTTNYVLNDHWITSVPLIALLRPFFDIHRAVILMVLATFPLTYYLMYLALRKLSVRPFLAWSGSLVFTFTPFITYQTAGHYTYLNHYLFPLIFLILANLFASPEKRSKIIWSIIFGLAVVYCLLTNFYYFLSIILALGFLLIFYLWAKRGQWKVFVKQYGWMFGLSWLTALITLLPWIRTVMRLIKFEGMVDISGFGGAIVLSADVTSFFMPSTYNPFYSGLIAKLSSISGLLAKFGRYYFHSWQTFAYPGMLVMASYVVLILCSKKLPRKIVNTLKPYLFTGLFFGLLMLGPFLKIANRWFLTTADGINVYFPLPFLILHYLPGMSTIRAPTRFAPIFVFLGVIIGCLLVNHWLVKMRFHRRLVVFMLLLAVFIIDQMSIISSYPKHEVPLRAYDYIKSGKPDSTVLEIPFTVRDGLQYIGSVHSTSFMRGALVHRKPVIGGYLSRLNPSVFSYYRSMPFIAHVAKIIDKGNYAIGKEEPGTPIVVPFTADPQKLLAEIDFLNIKYVLLKNDEVYSPTIRYILQKMGFDHVVTDGSYILWQRSPAEKDFILVNFGTPDDYLYLGSGFSIQEDGFRWAENKKAKVFIKTAHPDTIKQLSFDVQSFHQPQTVKVFLNQKFIGEQKIDTMRRVYQLPLNYQLAHGINTFDFVFSQSWKPSVVIAGNQDTRNLAVKFYRLSLE